MPRGALLELAGAEPLGAAADATEAGAATGAEFAVLVAALGARRSTLPLRAESPVTGAATLVALAASPENTGGSSSTVYSRTRWPRAQLTSTSTVAIGSLIDRKSTRLNSSHLGISYAVFCL